MALRDSLIMTALCVGMTVLSACDTAEERAEEHYQSGLDYLEAGDVERALVEFRNVFKLNGRHKEARDTYASVERERGNLREAFSQYLLMAELFPDDPAPKRALAEIAAATGDWRSAALHAGDLLAAGSQDPEIRAIKLAADYGQAADDNDVSGLIMAARGARELRDVVPGNLLLRRVIIDDLVRAQNYREALKELNSAIVLAPGERVLYAQRLSVNAALGNDEAVEEGLRDMVVRFPESPEMGSALVRWYISRNDLDKAETFLRNRVFTEPGRAPILELVRFLAEQRGPEVAVEELDRAIAAGSDSPLFHAARAGFIFDLGRKDEAIREMQALLKDAYPSDETRRAKVGLAQMLTATGNTVGARALVEEVLAEDAGDIEALKLKANWLIMDDDVGAAIATLRRALDQNPRNASIMTLMAQAYERDGNRDLMREMLSLAVDASGRAPGESLRYAQLLVAEGKLLPAEGVLLDALRIAPGDVSLLTPLGQIYLQVQDWSRARAVAEQLEKLDEQQAIATAQTIRAEVIAGEQQTDAAIGYLQKLVDEGKGGLAAKIAILRAHLSHDQHAKALAYSASLLAEDPDDPDLQFIDASVRAVTGDSTGAEAAYRQLVEENSDLVPAWMALARIILTDPARTQEAMALVDKGLTALPESAELKWVKAGLLERVGDYEGAIAIYEAMYQANSANPIIANNLASLLSNHRKDADSIARAEVIARRLRGSTVPAYQDTYGWIAYLRGAHQDAVRELTKAVEGLPDDPAVHFHLAMANLASGRKSGALAGFETVINLTEEGDDREFVQVARDELAKLEAEGVTIGN